MAKIKVQDTEISIVSFKEQDYICLTDMANAKESESRAADIIKNWLRNRYTIEFLGTWEMIHNPNFKVVEFDHFKMQAGLHNFVLSVSEWIEKTCAIGLIVKKGKYGGTYATMPLLINQVNITTMNNIVSQLFNYIINNEVVYQLCGELMEVSNDKEKENKIALLSYLSSAKRIEVYDKHNAFELDGCTELVNWSTDDDVLFLLQDIGVLICVPEKLAIDNKLIAA